MDLFIDVKFLKRLKACPEGIKAFRETFPNGAPRSEVMGLASIKNINYWAWLFTRTNENYPFDKLEIPSDLKRLDLGGGTLPEGTVLPEGLRNLFLDGGTIPAGTILPAELQGIYL